MVIFFLFTGDKKYCGKIKDCQIMAKRRKWEVLHDCQKEHGKENDGGEKRKCSL